MTILYFVRHADSPFAEGQERTRGLSAKGSRDAQKVKDLLYNEGIEAIVTSPYRRAKDTVQPLANSLGLPVLEVAEVRERSAGDFRGLPFAEAKRKLFADRALAFPGGESSEAAQARVVQGIEGVLAHYPGKRVVVGTHGDIMTLLFNHYDSRFGFSFWEGLSLPDIYRAEFDEGRLVSIARLWTGDE